MQLLAYGGGGSKSFKKVRKLKIGVIRLKLRLKLSLELSLMLSLLVVLKTHVATLALNNLIKNLFRIVWTFAKNSYST